jgi:hypothetical protein
MEPRNKRAETTPEAGVPQFCQRVLSVRATSRLSERNPPLPP